MGNHSSPRAAGTAAVPRASLLLTELAFALRFPVERLSSQRALSNGTAPKAPSARCPRAPAAAPRDVPERTRAAASRPAPGPGAPLRPACPCHPRGTGAASRESLSGSPAPSHRWRRPRPNRRAIPGSAAAQGAAAAARGRASA